MLDFAWIFLASIGATFLMIGIILFIIPYIKGYSNYVMSFPLVYILVGVVFSGMSVYVFFEVQAIEKQILDCDSIEKRIENSVTQKGLNSAFKDYIKQGCN